MIYFRLKYLMIIIYMEKLLSFDWLRQMQFQVIQCRRGFIRCKKSNKSDILIGQSSKKLTDSQSNVSLGYRSKIGKFASEIMAGVLKKKWFLEKKIAKEIENYDYPA